MAPSCPAASPSINSHLDQWTVVRQTCTRENLYPHCMITAYDLDGTDTRSMYLQIQHQCHDLCHGFDIWITVKSPWRKIAARICTVMTDCIYKCPSRFLLTRVRHYCIMSALPIHIYVFTTRTRLFSCNCCHSTNLSSCLPFLGCHCLNSLTSESWLVGTQPTAVSIPWFDQSADHSAVHYWTNCPLSQCIDQILIQSTSSPPSAAAALLPTSAGFLQSMLYLCLWVSNACCPGLA